MAEVIRLGISPCPNDTFIFGPMITGRVSMDAVELKPYIADVEELNNLACKGTLDVVKISVHAYLNVWENYCLLPAGGAISRKVGPIVVSKRRLKADELKNARIAIPGKRTTANLLLDVFGLHEGEKVEMVFHEIMPAISEGRVEAGVVIHEGRWTYSSYGLVCVCDLAEMWENMTHLPLPLGVIAIKRDLAGDLAGPFADLIRRSITYSRNNMDEVMPFIREHAQEMEEWIIFKHIESFVNDFSMNMGTDGRKAVKALLEKASGNEEVIRWDSIFCEDNPEEER